MSQSLPGQRSLNSDDRSFRLFVESVTDYAIFMLDRTGHVLTWNAGAERAKGYTEAEIVGQHLSTFYTPEDRAAGRPQRVLEAAVRDGRTEDEGWRVRKDGSRFWADVVVTAVHDEEGTLIGFGKVTRDMTERRTLQDAEQRARVVAEAASRAKDEFLATVSHELRTPLNVVLGELFRLRSGALDPAAAVRSWDSVERNVRLLTRLVEDLLDVSRVTTGKLRIEPQPIDLGRIVDAALGAARPAADIKGITMTAEIDPLTGPIVGDPVRLQQVIWNLLANAVKFTPTGGSIAVRVGRDGIDAVVRVSDTGIGIDPEFVERVFDRFTQADASTTRSESGLGLGLAIVKHLVEAHGGRVKATSPGLGWGATFEVRLPVPAVLPVGVLAAGSSSISLDGIRVLIVDDQPDARESLGGVLWHFGAEVRTAASVKEAMEALNDFLPHVLLADIAMPGEDGYELIRRLRDIDDPALRHLPAGALTAHSTVDDRFRVLSAGYQLHVAKPVQPLDLALAVAEMARKVHDVIASSDASDSPG